MTLLLGFPNLFINYTVMGNWNPPTSLRAFLQSCIVNRCSIPTEFDLILSRRCKKDMESFIRHPSIEPFFELIPKAVAEADSRWK